MQIKPLHHRFALWGGPWLNCHSCSAIFSRFLKNGATGCGRGTSWPHWAGSQPRRTGPPCRRRLTGCGRANWWRADGAESRRSAPRGSTGPRGVLSKVRWTTISFPKSNSRHIDLGDVSGIELRHRLKEAILLCRSSTSLGMTTPPCTSTRIGQIWVRPFRAALKRDHRIDGQAGNHVFEQGDSSAHKC